MRADVAPSQLTAAAAMWRRVGDERTALLVIALAIAAPLAAERYLAHRVTAELEPALTAATGVPTHVGGIEAGLTGTVTLREVEVEGLVAADSVEAAVSLATLLDGGLSPDEIRVTRPRVRAVADAAGREPWRAVLARLAARRRGGGDGGGGHRLRRIVVTGGDLIADVRGATLRARDLELHPIAGGVRVVTGALDVAHRRDDATFDGGFRQVALDVRLPSLTVERAALVGGTAAVALGGPTLRGHDVAVWRDGAGTWRASAIIDDDGAPRPLALAVDGRALVIAGERLPLAVLDGSAGPVALRDAHASGRLTIERDGDLRLIGDLALSGAAIDHRALADGPVELDLRAQFAARRSGGRLELERAVIDRGGLTVAVHGWLYRGADTALVGSVSLDAPPQACRTWIDDLPSALRGHQGEMVVRGTLGGAVTATVDLDAAPGDGVHLDVALANRCEVIADAPASDPRALVGVVDHRFPDGAIAPVGPGVGDWVALDEVPAHVRGAFVAAEDARFWHHDGFDLVQIARSLEIDLREERLARGGSTISQQLVKNAFLHQRRTLARKLEETVLTWRLEALLPKTSILERYLNVIELGPGVFGIAAAARHWFGRSPAQLTVRQAAFLAALTPAPRTISARLAAAHRLDPDTAHRVSVVLTAMRRAGVIDAATARDADATGLDLRPAALGR